MLVILHGPDTFRSREKLNEIVSAYRAKYGMGIREMRLDGDVHSWEDMRLGLYSGSLFVKKRLIVMRNIHTNKALLASFDPEGDFGKDVVVVFWEDKKLGANKEEKRLLSNAKICQEFSFLPPARLRSWASKFAEGKKISIEPQALALLVSWSGGNTWYLANEIQKLGAYVRGKKITEKDVTSLSRDILDSHIFQTLDAIFSGHTKEGMKLLHGHFMRGEHPSEIINMIAREVRVLASLKDGRRSGLHPFVIQKSTPRAKMVSWDALKSLSSIAHEADVAIKKGTCDPYLNLELLSMKVATLMRA